MIGMRSEVSGIRLDVTADAVQCQDERLGRVAGFDATGADPGGVDVVLLEGNAPQIGPDARKVCRSSVTHDCVSLVGCQANSGVPLGFDGSGCFSRGIADRFGRSRTARIAALSFSAASWASGVPSLSRQATTPSGRRSEEHTSELQSRQYL